MSTDGTGLGWNGADGSWGERQKQEKEEIHDVVRKEILNHSCYSPVLSSFNYSATFSKKKGLTFKPESIKISS